MLAEKKALSVEEIEAQTALELPDRELLALPVVIQKGLVNVAVGVEDVNVGVCANVVLLGQEVSQDCDVRQS